MGSVCAFTACKLVEREAKRKNRHVNKNEAGAKVIYRYVQNRHAGGIFTQDEFIRMVKHHYGTI